MTEASKHAAIDQTLSEWASAFSRSDADALAALVTDDAEFWSHGAPPINGRDGLRAALQTFFGSFSVVQVFEVHERLVADDWALLRGVELNTVTPADGGETFEFRQRAFSVLRRDGDGRWRFARGMTNQESSEPAD